MAVRLDRQNMPADDHPMELWSVVGEEPRRPKLFVTRDGWTTFLRGVKAGRSGQ